MKRSIIISLCLIPLSLVFVLSTSNTIAQAENFKVTNIDPNWDWSVFHTFSFSTAAIAFDRSDNLYATDIIDDWGPGIKNIIKFEAPEYDTSSIIISYDSEYDVINGMDFDSIGRLFVSECMGRNSGSDVGAIRKINLHFQKVSDPIEFIDVPGDGDFRPTGISATGFGTLYFPGRKWSEPDWGNIYKIKSFRKYNPNAAPSVYKEGIIGTAIAIDKWDNLYIGSRFPDNSIYTRNPFTGDLVNVATFNLYVEELAFDSGGNLYALEEAGDDPVTIIKLRPQYISIDDCDTGIIDWPLPDGSTISEMIENCKNSAPNHREFVHCMVHVLIELMNDGIINYKQMITLLLCSTRADIP